MMEKGMLKFHSIEEFETDSNRSFSLPDHLQHSTITENSNGIDLLSRNTSNRPNHHQVHHTACQLLHDQQTVRTIS